MNNRLDWLAIALSDFVTGSWWRLCSDRTVSVDLICPLIIFS